MNSLLVLQVALAGAVGASIGSFASTAALRHARGEQALFGRSHCDACETALGFASTVPVLSYIRFGGACAACRARIDPLHLAGELGGAAIGVSVILLNVSPPREAVLAVMGLALLTIALIDARTLRIPNAITSVVLAAAIVLSALRSVHALGTGAICAAIAFVILESLRRGYGLLRQRPGLGHGDVKLISALAVWLGLTTPWAIAAAALLGLAGFAVLKLGDQKIAFGPFIALGAFAVGFGCEAFGWATYS